MSGGADAPRFVHVALPVPLKEPLVYGVIPGLDAPLPGCRVRVPLGPRRVTGVVVGAGPRSPEGVPDDRIRDVLDVLDREPPLSPGMLVLCKRVAAETLTSWGEALALALPPGGVPASRRARPLSAPAGAEEGLAEPLTRVLNQLRRVAAVDSDVPVRRLGEQLADVPVHASLACLHRRGLASLQDEWSGPPPGRLVGAVRPAAGITRQRAREATERAPAQRRVVEALWDDPERAWRQTVLLEAAGTGHGTLAALADKGLVDRFRRPAARDGGVWATVEDGAGSFELTGDQAAGLEAVLSALDRPGAAPVLLHGVTGSGKTEVYLRAAASTLQRGRSALLLVPEIGLTPQLERRARRVLGDEVAVFHSGLSAGERLEAWWRARRGEARVALGPRSAVFAPLEDLGLVVVDEEQDGAYKQEERPRYNGRDVALWRGRLESAVVVMGSATPAVETFHRARQGAVRLLEMPRRVAARALPEVRVVDMRQEWQRDGRTLLSRELEDAMGERVGRGEQALLLLNRRGFANALLCRACGERIECPDCAVTLTLHRRDRSLVCHYCDHRIPVPDACPHCGAGALHDLGHGTERLQGVLEQALPGARIGRFDADETRRKGAHARILASFAAGEIDVLVGTQMLAKGHDFPGVTLVGVVGADAGLGMPDFRAAERTFQLLTQMAGRAGRGELPGEVLLQAHQVGHYAIETAADHDFTRFFSREIEFRRRLYYPPFSEIAVCLCRGKLLPVVREEAARLAAALRSSGDDSTRVLGPASPPIGRLRGRHRVQVLVKAGSRRQVVSCLGAALRRLEAAGKMPRDLVVDVDPRNLM